MSISNSFNLRIFGGENKGPHLLITAGIHGDEFEGIAAIHRLIAALDGVALNGKVTLVPIVNGPAFIRGARTAEDGLDLARQCPGTPEGTITVQLAHALSELIRSAEYYIDLHSGGVAMSVTPLAGYMLHPKADVLEKQRRMARAFNMPLVWGTSPALEGRSLSVARDANIPAIYAEYLGSGVCNAQGVEDYFEGCLNVMSEIGMCPHAAPPSKVERVVEDSRPNSGHLQVAHPSPITGLFESYVELSQEVRAGDTIGRVVDPVGKETCKVVAEQSGIVICLAAYARVIKGSGLAVVMETQANNVTFWRR